MSLKPWIRLHPLTSYFCMTFLISWVGAMCLVAPWILRGEPIPKIWGIGMFPVMLLGPSLSGIILTKITLGKTGSKALFSRMKQGRVGLRWYLFAIVIIPVLILLVLGILSYLDAEQFRPQFMIAGLALGIPAGYLEEIGWSGYSFPRMQAGRNGFKASIQLGVLWVIWHAPVMGWLGSSSGSVGHYPLYFIGFLAVMIPMRLLICWLTVRTGSVLMAQIMHACSTGFLVVFSPQALSSSAEALWYILYAVALWIIVLLILLKGNTRAWNFNFHYLETDKNLP